MITTVTLNPCIDKTVVVKRFEYGATNRILQGRQDFGGKGFNVAKCLANHGQEVVASGFLFAQNAKGFEDSLAEFGVRVNCALGQGCARTNTKIFDESKKVITELNEGGAMVTTGMVDKLLEMLDEMAKNSDYLVLAGSMPPGVQDCLYGDIIKRYRKCKIVLDAEGEKFKLGVAQLPYIIKPNFHELEILANRKFKTNREIIGFCSNLIDLGIGIIVVSMGKDGALAIDEKGAYLAKAVSDIEVQSTVGAGDGMVAGLLCGLMQGENLQEAFRYAVASASCSITLPGTQMANKEGTEQMLGRVEVLKA